MLSPNDERILNAVFDPESAPDAPTAPIDPSLPPDPHIQDPALLQRLQAQELQAIRLIEALSLKPRLSFGGGGAAAAAAAAAPEVDTYASALRIFDDLAAECPTYASVFNNRAQLRRWWAKDRLTTRISTGTATTTATETKETNGGYKELAETIADLKRAIELASPASPGTAISPRQSKLLVQAWTQLGAVYVDLGKELAQVGGTWSDGGDEKQKDSEKTNENEEDWRSWDSMKFEEEGSRCFYMSGLYGSEMGKGLAVKMNPYARLCSGIVKEAMKREMVA